MKRLFDVFFAIAVLVVLFPILLPIVIILKLTGEGEIFFLQNRVGKGGKIFKMYKFATMLKNSPNMGLGDITVKNDPRVLPFGKFLRKTKLNEIPQVLNILFGEMSVVGPRPITKKNFDYYTEKQKEIISSIKPGLTGVGSLFFRDEESILENSEKDYINCYKEDIAPYKAQLELWYYENQSFLLDILICLFTGWVVIFPKSDIYMKVFKTIPKKI